jgi:hypothetical protein
VAFDKLELQRIIDRVGYIYVYVSNESEGTGVWMISKSHMVIHPLYSLKIIIRLGCQSERAFERGCDKYEGMFTTDGTGLKDLGFHQ